MRSRPCRTVAVAAATLVAALVLAVGHDTESASARTRLAEVRLTPSGDANFPRLLTIAGGRAALRNPDVSCRLVGADGTAQALDPCSERLLASPTRILALVRTEHSDGKSYTGTDWVVKSSPFRGAAGSAGTIARCVGTKEVEVEDPRRLAVALDGDIAAVAIARDCGPSATIGVFDASVVGPSSTYSNPAPPLPPPVATVRAPSPVTHVALAGATLAYATAGGIGVVDRTNGGPQYAPALPAGLEPGSVAVRPDATMAAVMLDRRRAGKRPGLCEGRSVWRFSAAEPAGRKLADHACDAGIEFAGDDVIVERLGPDRRIELDRVGARGAITMLAALRIDPSIADDPTLSATRMFDSVRAASFADNRGVFSDGANVAFVQADGCRATAHVYLQSIGEPAPRGDRFVPKCLPRLGALEFRAGRGGEDVTFHTDGTDCIPDEHPCSVKTASTTISCAKACQGVAYWNAEPLKRRADGLAEPEEPESERFEIEAGGRLRVRVLAQDCWRPGMRLRLTVITAPGVKREVRRTMRCPRADRRRHHAAP